MASPRTLRNVTHLAGLGLSNKDARLIKDLLTISRELRGDFDYSDKASISTTDILFVNSDHEKAMAAYAKHSARMHAEPIFVFNRKTENETETPHFSEYPNAKTLSTPITLAGLSGVLLEMVSAQNSDTKSGSDSCLTQDCFKILVVDDSFPVRKYMEEKLPVLMAEIDMNLHFEIDFAASGRESVEKVKAARGAYDIVFLDIMMEDIDGYQICKWIKKVKRSINVVMLTSKSSPFDRVRANLSGCDNYLSKPPEDSHLKKVILKHRKFEQTADTNRILEN